MSRCGCTGPGKEPMCRACASACGQLRAAHGCWVLSVIRITAKAVPRAVRPGALWVGVYRVARDREDKESRQKTTRKTKKEEITSVTAIYGYGSLVYTHTHTSRQLSQFHTLTDAVDSLAASDEAAENRIRVIDDVSCARPEQLPSAQRADDAPQKAKEPPGVLAPDL
jgi:hypothetical protein